MVKSDSRDDEEELECSDPVGETPKRLSVALAGVMFPLLTIADKRTWLIVPGPLI